MLYFLIAANSFHHRLSGFCMSSSSVLYTEQVCTYICADVDMLRLLIYAVHRMLLMSLMYYYCSLRESLVQ